MRSANSASAFSRSRRRKERQIDADQWNARYEGARLWADVPPRVFQEVVSEWIPGRGLDLATGDGRNAV